MSEERQTKRPDKDILARTIKDVEYELSPKEKDILNQEFKSKVNDEVGIFYQLNPEPLEEGTRNVLYNIREYIFLAQAYELLCCSIKKNWFSDKERIEDYIRQALKHKFKKKGVKIDMLTETNIHAIMEKLCSQQVIVKSKKTAAYTIDEEKVIKLYKWPLDKIKKICDNHMIPLFEEAQKHPKLLRILYSNNPEDVSKLVLYVLHSDISIMSIFFKHVQPILEEFAD